MKRFLTSLLALAASVGVALSTPRGAEAMPLCPRGATFTYCQSYCDASPQYQCNQVIGVPQNECPVESASCEPNNPCDNLGPVPYLLTCTWYV